MPSYVFETMLNILNMTNRLYMLFFYFNILVSKIDKPTILQKRNPDLKNP